MAEALLITRADIVKFTAMNGNVDTDKFIPFIKIAQDVHVQNYLGTELLEKIQLEITNDTLADPYLSLLETYIKPMLIHWAMVEYLPWAAYTIADKGVYKHTSENAENVSKSEVDFMLSKQEATARHYTQRFIDFMCFQGSTFPEYYDNTNGDMNPDRTNNYGGWYL